MAVHIDLNADLGEGMGSDDALLRAVSSANVACGAHAGDDATMRRVCDVAVERGIIIGAHVAYPDRAHFGRRAVDIEPDALADEVVAQISRLARHALAAGGRVDYVKPHGALYHRVAVDEDQAGAFVRAMAYFDSTGPEPTGRAGKLGLLGMAGSLALEYAEATGLPVATEAFADRAYRADGSLVPRSEDGAVVHDPDVVTARSLAIAAGEPIEAIDGSQVTVTARSLCVHGDTPAAASLAARVRVHLEGAGVTIVPWVRQA